MIICVEASLQVRLVEPADFRHFSVRIASPDLQIEEARQALSGTAELEDRTTAWVSERALRDWPGLEVDAGAWQSGLDQMIAKAKPHGWVDEAKHRIKAHVEWTGDATPAGGSGATSSAQGR